MAQDDADNGTSASTRSTSDEKRELAELRAEKRRLEIENEVLERVAAYLAHVDPSDRSWGLGLP